MGVFDKYIEKNRKYWYDFPNRTLKGEYETNAVGNKHGVEKLYHENGQLASQLNFSNGIQDDGEVLSYHKDGSKARKVIILNNKFNGEFFEWYENGNLKIQGTYVDGKILGIYKSWDIDNVKQSDFFKIVPNSYTKGYDYEEKKEIEVNWLQDIGPVYSRNINYYGSDAEKLNILSYTPNTIDEEEYISIFCTSSEESINIINHIINLNG
jgi:antitoxin component YwqK of YwqJK toxin-antitoxin module